MLPRLPFLKRRGAEPGVFSLVSGDSLMRSLTRQHKLPSTVHTRFVSVVDHKHSGRAFGVPHPLRSLYSHDLGRGELARLRKLLRERGPNPLLDHDELGRLAYFRLLGLTHVHGLSNALRMLRHAAWIAARHAKGYKRFAADVRRAARSGSDAKFAAAWDAALSRLTPTFYGGHTSFMWTHKAGQKVGGAVNPQHLVDKPFIEWLSGELSANRAEHDAAARP